MAGENGLEVDKRERQGSNVEYLSRMGFLVSQALSEPSSPPVSQLVYLCVLKRMSD